MFFLFSSFHFITRIKTILIVTFIAIIVIAIAISISIVNVCSSKQFLFALSVCLSCRQSCCYWVRLGDFVALRVIRLLLPFHFISFHFISFHSMTLFHTRTTWSEMIDKRQVARVRFHTIYDTVCTMRSASASTSISMYISVFALFPSIDDDWLFDWLIHWTINSFIHSFINWSIDWSIGVVSNIYI